MASRFATLFGDVAKPFGEGLAAGMGAEDELRRLITGQQRVFEALRPQREAQREEELAAALAKERAAYGLKRELGAPQREEFARYVGPALEKAGIFPEMAPEAMPSPERAEAEVPRYFQGLEQLDPDLAQKLLDYAKAKERTEGSDVWKAIAAMQAAERIEQGQQRIDLSKVPPPAAEEDLQLKAARFLAAHGIDDLHPDFPRLLNSTVEGLRRGEEINVIERESTTEETKQPSWLERMLGGVPYPVTKRTKQKDIQVGPARGGRTRPATRPQPVGGAGKAKPQIPQPTVPLKPAEEKALNRYRYVPGKGLVPVGQ